jgi:hemolysin D
MSMKQRLEAYQELLRRYRQLFAHFWKLRKSLDGGIFNEDEAEFLPAALSLQKKPLSPAGRTVGRVVVALVLFTIVWSIVCQVDIIVNATGKIIPDVRTKTIASVETASVRALYVQEGQTVTAGELLIDLDASESDAARNKAAGDESMDVLEAARSKALIRAVDTLRPPVMPKLPGIPIELWKTEQAHLDGQYSEFMADLERDTGNVRRYAESLKLATQTADDYRDLLKSHDVSIEDYSDKEEARVEAERQMEDAENERAGLVAETRRQAYDSLADGVKTAASSLQDALSAASHSRLLQLRAPVDGTVQQLTVFTVGGVVQAAQPIMSIVPKNSGLEVEADLKDKDVGFVNEGQIAEVKVDAFEYTKYGTIPARVVHISRDAIQDDKKGLIYSVLVALNRSTIFVDGHTENLGPGMSVNVAIKTGQRRIISYVMSPLIRHARDSLNER